MKNNYVVAVDAARARFFLLDTTGGRRQRTSGPHLREVSSLENPESAVPEGAMFSSIRSGGNHGPTGQVHSYDDHRERHERVFARRFADQVSERCVELVRDHGAGRLILAAEARMLGMLRQGEARLNRLGAELHDLPLDLAPLDAAAIQRVLARRALLPAAKPQHRRIRVRV